MSRGSADAGVLGNRVESEVASSEHDLLSCSIPKTFYVPGTVFTPRKEVSSVSMDVPPHKIKTGFAPAAK